MASKSSKWETLAYSGTLPTTGKRSNDKTNRYEILLMNGKYQAVSVPYLCGVYSVFNVQDSMVLWFMVELFKNEEIFRKHK